MVLSETVKNFTSCLEFWKLPNHKYIWAGTFSYPDLLKKTGEIVDNSALDDKCFFYQNDSAKNKPLTYSNMCPYLLPIRVFHVSINFKYGFFFLSTPISYSFYLVLNNYLKSLWPVWIINWTVNIVFGLFQITFFKVGGI